MPVPRLPDSAAGASMRHITIELADDIFNHLEIRAAIDDLRSKEGIELLLTELVTAHKSKK